MYQIAIGDPLAGYTVLHGASVSPPALKTTCYFTFSADPFVTERIELQLKGTPAQITALLNTLDVVIQRANLYDLAAYPSPQYLRFQTAAASAYYVTPISRVYLESNPAGYIHHQQGSRLITLHYTRPNYFDGPKTELPLSGRAGTNITGGYPLYNHTDSGANHGSTALVNPAHLVTSLPAPLRFEITFTTPGPAPNLDLFVGVFSHPSYYSDLPFFAYYNALIGGSATADGGAIQGNYKTFTWTSAAWEKVTYYNLDSSVILYFSGSTYRPIVHFFAPHAYTDLYFRVQVERSGEVLFVSEPVYSPAGFGYLALPPINLPPNFLLGDVNPASVEIALYAFRESGALTSVDIDCLTVFPLGAAASFYGFVPLLSGHALVDDSHRGRFNLRTSSGAGESVGHTRIGGDLTLRPGHFSRLFFYGSDDLHTMPIVYQYDLLAFYYPRVRFL